MAVGRCWPLVAKLLERPPTVGAIELLLLLLLFVRVGALMVAAA